MEDGEGGALEEGKTPEASGVLEADGDDVALEEGGTLEVRRSLETSGVSDEGKAPDEG